MTWSSRATERIRLPGMGFKDKPIVKHIGIVLFADVEELDAIGPWEVFSA
jgi:hypothetical protein